MRTRQKLTLRCGRRRKYQSLVALETCVLGPVRVGAWRYGGLRYMDVIVCFDSLATACSRLLSETAFLSLGVTRCYFFPHCWVRQNLAERAKRPGKSECFFSRCLSLLRGWRFPAAWWQEVVGVHGLSVTAVLSDSWSCRNVLLETGNSLSSSSLGYLTRLAKAVLVNWHSRVKFNSSVLLWGNGI